MKHFMQYKQTGIFLFTILLLTGCATEQLLLDKRDGQEYATVEIGDQVWMAENLNFRTEHSWYYDNDSSSYAAKYGRLYTWEDASKACPVGWHLPSDEEWKALEKFIGMSFDVLDIAGYRDSIAYKIKPGGATGLNLDFGGYRMMWGDGSFHYARDYGDYWTNTRSGQVESWYRNVSRFQNTIYRNRINTAIGNSVRCVKTNE